MKKGRHNTMYELTVVYFDKKEDTILCTSQPSYEIENGYLFLDCGSGQSLTLNIETFLKVRIKPPLPTNVPAFHYSIDIQYSLVTDDVELLFSSHDVDVSTHGDDYGRIIVVEEDRTPIRIINSDYLKSIKVTTYSEKG